MTADFATVLQDGLADRYRLERELGRGGMATVYLAQDLRHKRPVALKVLHPELARTLGPERFQREIETVARLQHPHILSVHDSGETAGQLWFTMPFVEGESLRDRLRRERQLPLDDALRITREVADALGYAHSQGVVHRDIKPENILLSRGHALVADFGVARSLQTGDGGHLTETGMSVGTPAYMSPEQSMADPVLDGRSDLYSLGCVLYEMLAGEAPYTGTSAQAIMAKRLREPVPHVRTVRETVPLSVDQTLERVLAKTPADRFATAEAFVQALTVGSGQVETSVHSSDDLGGGATTASTSTALPSSSGSTRRVRISAVVLALAVAVVAMGVLLWQRHRHMETSTTREHATPDDAGPALGASQLSAPGQPSVAVLPFTNLSSERENEYFSDGMTEELITALGKVEGLRVAARASSFAFKGKPLDVGQVSRALNVGAVLDGSVRRSGRRLRVTAELVNARDGSRLWADSYDRELRDVFRVQDELARAIVGALRVPLRLAARSDTTIVRAATKDPEAHDLYLQGRFLWNQRTYESLQRAADFFERAATRDPAYAQAYAGLADTYIVLPQYGAIRPRDALAKARRAVERALILDSTSAEAHASLGTVRLYEYDWRGAETEFRRALALNPSYATAHQWYGLYLSWVGRPDEALTEVERARALDPLSRIISSVLGSRLALSGRYDDAIRQLRSTLRLDPNFVPAQAWLCTVYLMKGDARSAITACERVATLTNRRFGLGGLVSAYAAAGDHARAMVVLRELEARASREYVSPWQFAEAYLGLGDRDRTFAWLDSAYAAHDPFLLTTIVSPLWDPVRSDPRFARLRARLGLPP